MGVYYEFVAAMQLKKEVPANVLLLLKYLLGEVDKNDGTIEHFPWSSAPHFYAWFRWDEHAFPVASQSKLVSTKYGHELTIRMNYKALGGTVNDVANFLMWIAPHCESFVDGFVGYHRSDQGVGLPRLIYIQDGVAYWVDLLTIEKIRIENSGLLDS